MKGISGYAKITINKFLSEVMILNYIIDREPNALFNYFEDICAIPHGSGNESMIADYIENFAVSHGLYCYRDKNNNVLIKRKASAGYEDHAPVMIQGHLDMVCEADDGVCIDFEKDPLKLRVCDGYLMAEGTTLGADDGVAVAIMLALLSDEKLASPEIECLFTTEEETGLTGASEFDYGKISARKMINLDTGGEVIIASCAGGMRTRITDTPKTEKYSGKAVSIEISGLAGGHSGADIHLGLANANLLMIDILKAVRESVPASIISMKGGTKDNAITSRASALIRTDDAKLLINAANRKIEEIRKGLIKADEGSVFSLEETDYDGVSPTPEFTDRLIGFTDSIPKNVIAYNENIGMVETSLNYAVISVEKDSFELHLSSRSSISEELDKVGATLENKASEFKFSSKTDSRYEGWAYEEKSEMREAYINAYRKITGKEISVMGIHAGLECGIIKLAVPEMDIIATGAVTVGEHTTKEALDLESFATVYKTIVFMLAEQ